MPTTIGRWRLAGLIVGMSLMFGNNFVALAVALRDAGPITVQAVSSSLAAITALLVTRADQERSTATRRETVIAIGSIGVVLSVGAPILIAFGVQRVNPGIVAMLVAAAPLTTLILERVVLRIRLSRLQVLGVVVGLVGVAMIVSPFRSEGASQLSGVVFVVGGAMCWATGLILTRRLPGVHGGGRFVAWQFVVGVPILWLLAVVTEGARINWTMGFVLAVVFSGAISKGLASVLQYRTVRYSSPLHSSLSAFLVPAVGVASSYLILGETVEPIQVVGGVVVGVAVSMVIQARAGSVVS